MADQPSQNAQAAGSAIGALVGAAIAGPLGSVVGAAVTPAAIAVTHLAFGELRGVREASAASVLAAAAETLKVDSTDLVTEALQRPSTSQHLNDALVAGANTFFDWKIAALAMALANGLAGDGAKVDVEGLMLRALRELEPPHVRALLFIKEQHGDEYALRVALKVSEGTLAAIMASLDRLSLVKSDAIQKQRAYNDERFEAIKSSARPDTSRFRRSEPAFPSSETWSLTGFGEDCLAYLTKFPVEPWGKGPFDV